MRQQQPEFTNVLLCNNKKNYLHCKHISFFIGLVPLLVHQPTNKETSRSFKIASQDRVRFLQVVNAWTTKMPKWPKIASENSMTRYHVDQVISSPRYLYFSQLPSIFILCNDVELLYKSWCHGGLLPVLCLNALNSHESTRQSITSFPQEWHPLFSSVFTYIFARIEY